MQGFPWQRSGLWVMRFPFRGALPTVLDSQPSSADSMMRTTNPCARVNVCWNDRRRFLFWDALPTIGECSTTGQFRNLYHSTGTMLNVQLVLF